MAAATALARGSIHDNVELNRLELDVAGGTAIAEYRLSPGVLTITHTEVPPELRHRGIGSELARSALEWARARGLKVAPQCPFVASFMESHREFDDLRR